MLGTPRIQHYHSSMNGKKVIGADNQQGRSNERRFVCLCFSKCIVLSVIGRDIPTRRYVVGNALSAMAIPTPGLKWKIPPETKR